jgi:hypothetical protein
MSYTRRDTTEDRKSDISCHEYFESLVVLIYVTDTYSKELTYVRVLNKSDRVSEDMYFICDTVSE